MYKLLIFKLVLVHIRRAHLWTYDLVLAVIFFIYVKIKECLECQNLT